MRDFLQWDLLAEFFRDGCDRLRFDPTGNNQIKISEIGIHIQGESVGSDTARDVDADGGDFGFMLYRRLTSLRLVRTGEVARPYVGIACVPIGPDSGKSGDAPCRNSEIRTSSDQYFLEPPHVLDRAESLSRAVDGETTQIEDGIRDELTRPVESHVTAAIAFENVDTALGELFRRSENVLGLSISSKRNDRRVLEQQKNVADESVFTQVDKPLLQLQASGVIHDVELDDRDQIRT